MPPDELEKLDPAVVAALYLEHEAELKRLLWGVLRDSQLACDVLQAAFVKLMECGHTTRAESRKAWLFRVAMNEALAIRRRQAMGKRVVDGLPSTRVSVAADEPLIRYETIQSVRRALEELPPDQRRIVEMRIYDEKTFAQIAQELNIPLGTALGRMRLALAKLRQALPDYQSP